MRRSQFILSTYVRIMETPVFVLTVTAIFILLHMYRYEITDLFYTVKAYVKRKYFATKYGGGGSLTFAT